MKTKRVKRDRIEFEGVVTEAFKSATFRVEIKSGESNAFITCTLCGKMKENFIKIIPGDKVKIEVSPYDMTKGRIIQRIKF